MPFSNAQNIRFGAQGSFKTIFYEASYDLTFPETVFRKSKSEPPKWFHLKVCQTKSFENWFWSYFEVKNKYSKRLKMDFFCLFFFVFCFSHLSVNKLKMFSGKARQSIQNCVNPKSDIENVLENGFKTTLRSKVDVLLNLWKRKFSVFRTFLSQEVETAYCERKAKRSKVF